MSPARRPPARSFTLEGTRRSQLVVRHFEDFLESPHVAGLKAQAEPFHPLRRRAVSVLLRRVEAAGALLQTVVADRVGGLDGRLNVSGLQEVERLLAVMRPNA